MKGRNDDGSRTKVDYVYCMHCTLARSGMSHRSLVYSAVLLLYNL